MGVLGACEGEGAEDELVHDHSQGVDILLAGERVQAQWGLRWSVRESSSRRVNELSMLPSSLSQWKLGASVLVIRLSEIDQLDQEILDNNDVAGGDIQMRNLITLKEPYRIRQVRQYVQLGWMSEGLFLEVHLFCQGVAWDVVHEKEGTVLVIALDGVVVFGKVTAADWSEVA